MDRFDVGYAASDWSPDQFLPALNDISALGYAGIDIATDVVQIFSGREEEFLSLLRLVKLRVAAVCGGFLLTEPRFLKVDMEVARQAFRFLSTVAKGGALVAIPGEFEGDRTDGIFRVSWTLSKIADEAAAAGVRICVKPHRGSVLNGIEEIGRFLELTEGARDRIFLALDTGHMTLTGTDVVECIRTWPGRIGHVHLTDVPPRPKENSNPLVEPGTGTADLPSIVYALRKARYEGWVIGRVDSPPVSPRESAAACARYFRERLDLDL